MDIIENRIKDLSVVFPNDIQFLIKEHNINVTITKVYNELNISSCNITVQVEDISNKIKNLYPNFDYGERITYAVILVNDTDITYFQPFILPKIETLEFIRKELNIVKDHIKKRYNKIVENYYQVSVNEYILKNKLFIL